MPPPQSRCCNRSRKGQQKAQVLRIWTSKDSPSDRLTRSHSVCGLSSGWLAPLNERTKTRQRSGVHWFQRSEQSMCSSSCTSVAVARCSPFTVQRYATAGHRRGAGTSGGAKVLFDASNSRCSSRYSGESVALISEGGVGHPLSTRVKRTASPAHNTAGSPQYTWALRSPGSSHMPLTCRSASSSEPTNDPRMGASTVAFSTPARHSSFSFSAISRQIMCDGCVSLFGWLTKGSERERCLCKEYTGSISTRLRCG